MTTFGEAITNAHAAVITGQERALEKHLRIHGTSQLESFESALCLRRSYPRISPFEFDRIVQRQRDRKAKK